MESKNSLKTLFTVVGAAVSVTGVAAAAYFAYKHFKPKKCYDFVELECDENFPLCRDQMEKLKNKEQNQTENENEAEVQNADDEVSEFTDVNPEDL